MAWRDLYSYWRGHHVDGRPPTRAEIDPPTQIPRLLPNLMLIDIEASGFRLRLAGSELTRRAGYDATGKILDPTRMPEREPRKFLGFLERVAATGTPVLYSESHNDRSTSGAIGLVLPLTNAAGSTHMILGGVFFEPGGDRNLGRGRGPDSVTELVLADELAREAQLRYER